MSQKKQKQRKKLIVRALAGLLVFGLLITMLLPAIFAR